MRTRQKAVAEAEEAEVVVVVVPVVEEEGADQLVVVAVEAAGAPRGAEAEGALVEVDLAAVGVGNTREKKEGVNACCVLFFGCSILAVLI